MSIRKEIIPLYLKTMNWLTENDFVVYNTNVYRYDTHQHNKDGQSPDFDIVEEGTEAVFTLSILHPTQQPKLFFDVCYLNCFSSVVYRNSSFQFSDRIEVIMSSDHVAQIEIKNVSKSDQGLYCIWQLFNHQGRKCLLFLTKGKDLIQYNKTILLKDNSTFMLKIEDISIIRKRIAMLTLKRNGTMWTSSATNWRFCLLSCDDLHYPTIISDNITTDDEGIYRFMVYDPYPLPYNVLPRPPVERYVRILIKNLTFKKQKDQFITIGTEGQSLSIVCEINSRYEVEEMYITANGKVLIYGDPPLINYTFVPSTDDHLRHYTCSARLKDYPTTIDKTTQLVINHVYTTETDVCLRISIVAALILLLYIIVLQIVCCYQWKNQKRGRYDTTENNEYDEIGTVSYHTISIPPLALRQPRLDYNSSDLRTTLTESDVIIEAADQVNENSHNDIGSTSPDDSSYEEVKDVTNKLVGYNIHDSVDTFNGDVEGTSNLVTRIKIHSPNSIISVDTSCETVDNDFDQLSKKEICNDESSTSSDISFEAVVVRLNVNQNRLVCYSYSTSSYDDVDVSSIQPRDSQTTSSDDSSSVIVQDSSDAKQRRHIRSFNSISSYYNIDNTSNERRQSNSINSEDSYEVVDDSPDAKQRHEMCNFNCISSHDNVDSSPNQRRDSKSSSFEVSSYEEAEDSCNKKQISNIVTSNVISLIDDVEVMSNQQLNSESTSSKETSDEEVKVSSHQPPENIIRDSDSSGSLHISDQEGQGISTQPTASQSDHAYTQPVSDREEEHKYMDCFRYVNSEVNKS